MAVVSVFVSSTFRDFHAERDAIRSQVVPQLDVALAPLGARVEMLDLRWGVDTTTTDSDEAHRRVLGVCLSEIERCRPLFVGLVGDRFGWVPRPEDLAEACEGAGVRAALPREPPPAGLSITALECWFGGLISGSMAVFALRDQSPSRPSAWLDADRSGIDWLRDTILETADREPDRVSTFTYGLSLDELVSHLVSVLTPLVVARAQELVGGGLSPYQAATEARAQQWHIIAGRRVEVDRLRERLLDPDGPVGLVVTGTSGMGKSTVVKAVGDECAAIGWGVARVHLGIAPGSSSIEEVSWLVGEQLRWPPPIGSVAGSAPSTPDWLAWWGDHLEDAPEHTLVVLDGLDQFDAGTPRDLLPLLDGAALAGEARFLLATTDDRQCHVLTSRGLVVERLGPLAPGAVRQAARDWAVADGRRELPAAVVDAWASEPRSGLWVRMAVAELNGLRREHFERAEATQATGVSPSEAITRLVVAEGSALPASDIQLADRILDRTVRAIGSEHRAALLLGALAVTRSGLTPADLGAVAGLDAVTLTRARWALGSQLVARDRTDRLAFAHGLLREAAGRRTDPGSDVHKRIAQVLQPASADTVEKLDCLWHALHSADPAVEGRSLISMPGLAAIPVLRATAREDTGDAMATWAYWSRDPVPLDLTGLGTDQGIEACLGAIWERGLGLLAIHLRGRMASTLAAQGTQWRGAASLAAELDAAQVFHQAMGVRGLGAFENDPSARWALELDAAEAAIVEDGGFYGVARQALMHLRLAVARLEVARVCLDAGDPDLLRAAQAVYAGQSRLQELTGSRLEPRDAADPRHVLVTHNAALVKGEQVATDGWRNAVAAARTLFLHDPESREVAAELVNLLGGLGWAMAGEGRDVDAIDTWLDAAAVKIPLRDDSSSFPVANTGPRDHLSVWVLGVEDDEVVELLDGTLATGREQAAPARALPEFEAMMARAELALTRARALHADADDLELSILRACRLVVRIVDRHPVPDPLMVRATVCRARAISLRDSILEPIVAQWDAALAAHRSGSTTDRSLLIKRGSRADSALGKAGFHGASFAAWLDRHEIIGPPTHMFGREEHPYAGVLRRVLAAFPSQYPDQDSARPQSPLEYEEFLDRIEGGLQALEGRQGAHERLWLDLLKLADEAADDCLAACRSGQLTDAVGRRSWLSLSARAFDLSAGGTNLGERARREVMVVSGQAHEAWALSDVPVALAHAERAVAAMANAGNLTHDQPARRMFTLALRLRALSRDALDSPMPVLLRSRSHAARTAWRELRFELELQAALGWATQEGYALTRLSKLRGG